MSVDNIRVEFRERASGKNAAEFWVGVATIVALFYAMRRGWFSAIGMALGFIDAPEDGLESVMVPLAFDTVCLIGLGTMTAYRLMRKYAIAVSERASYLLGGMLAWSQKEQSEGAEAPSLAVSREREALANHEHRLRNQLARIEALEDEILDQEVDADSIDDFFDVDDDDDTETLLGVISELRRSNDELKAQVAWLREKRDAGDSTSDADGEAE